MLSTYCNTACLISQCGVLPCAAAASLMRDRRISSTLIPSVTVAMVALFPKMGCTYINLGATIYQSGLTLALHPALTHKLPTMQKLIITAALTGAEVTREQQPALPFTPEEIAIAAEECVQAGAAMVHVHARNADGSSTQDMESYRKIIAAVRKRCDVIVQ